MSLTSQLADSESPVRTFFSNHFPSLPEFLVDWRALVGSLSTHRPTQQVASELRGERFGHVEPPSREGNPHRSGVNQTWGSPRFAEEQVTHRGLAGDP